MNGLNDNIWNSKLVDAQTSSVPSNLGYNIVNNIKYNLSDQYGRNAPITYNYSQGGNYGSKILDYDINNRTGYTYVTPIGNPVNTVANEQKQYSKQQMFEDYVNHMIYDAKGLTSLDGQNINTSEPKESFTPRPLSQSSGLYERSPYFGTAENNRFDPVVAGWRTPQIQTLTQPKESYESPLPVETISMNKFEDNEPHVDPSAKVEVPKNKEVTRNEDINSGNISAGNRQVRGAGSILIINIVVLVVIVFIVIIGMIFYFNAQRSILNSAYSNKDVNFNDIDSPFMGGMRSKKRNKSIEKMSLFKPKESSLFGGWNDPWRHAKCECKDCDCDCSKCKSGHHSKCKNCSLNDDSCDW